MSTLPRDSSVQSVPYFAWDGTANIVLLSVPASGGLAAIIADGAADPVTSLIGAGGYVYDPGTHQWYKARTLGTAGYAAGVPTVAPANDTYSNAYTAATLAGGLTDVIAARSQVGIRRRAISFNWTGNGVLTVHCMLDFGNGTGVGLQDMLVFTLPVGNVNGQQVVYSDGALLRAAGSGATVTAGAEGAFNAAAQRLRVRAQSTGGTAGQNLTVDYSGQT